VTSGTITQGPALPQARQTKHLTKSD